MKLHGISGLHIIREVLTDNCRKSDIDGIAEENTRKRFRNNCLYSKCLKNARCLLSGRAASEVLSSHYKISRFHLLGKIRIQ